MSWHVFDTFCVLCWGQIQQSAGVVQTAQTEKAECWVFCIFRPLKTLYWCLLTWRTLRKSKRALTLESPSRRKVQVKSDLHSRHHFTISFSGFIHCGYCCCAISHFHFILTDKVARICEPFGEKYFGEIVAHFAVTVWNFFFTLRLAHSHFYFFTKKYWRKSSSWRPSKLIGCQVTLLICWSLTFSPSLSDLIGREAEILTFDKLSDRFMKKLGASSLTVGRDTWNTDTLVGSAQTSADRRRGSAPARLCGAPVCLDPSLPLSQMWLDLKMVEKALTNPARFPSPICRTSATWNTGYLSVRQQRCLESYGVISLNPIY